MKKKILFVILPYILNEDKLGLKSFLSIPYGVLSIASFIKDYAEVRIFDCNTAIPWGHGLIKTLSDFKPDIVGVSMQFEISYKYLEEALHYIQFFNTDIECHLKKTEIIIGGESVNYNAEEILKSHPEIDAVCIGEGELPVWDYITSGVFRQGWMTRNNSTVTKYNAEELDDFIDIDYSLIDIELYQKFMEESYSPHVTGKDKRQFMIVSSRGCPFSCHFCRNSTNTDKSIRYASVNSIIAHVEQLIIKYEMNVLTFWDDQLIYNQRRAKELFKRLAVYNLRIEIPSGVSPSYLDKELLTLMRKAGVDTLYLALESGSHDVLKMMNKPVNLSQVRNLIPIIRELDFFVMVFLVIGMPGETDKHRQETIDYIREIQPDLVSVRICVPVPGSKLRQECLDKGYIDNDFGKYLSVDAVINTPEYSAEYLNSECLRIMRLFNYTENYRIKIGDYKTAKHYAEYVLSKYKNESYAIEMLERIPK